MENDNIISFEEHRKKKAGHSYKEDALSQLFKKDLSSKLLIIKHDLETIFGVFNVFNKFIFGVYF